MLGQRILTAAVLIPLVLAALWFLPTSWVTLIVGAVILLGAWEWTALMSLSAVPQRLGYVALVAVLGGLACRNLTDVRISELIMLVSLLWWIAAFVWILFYPAGLPAGSRRLPLKGVVGVLVLVPAIPAVAMLHAMGPLWLLLLLVIIWAADTGAYFAGRALGKHKLAPRVSPGKTWEGFAGGMLAGAVVSVVAVWLFQLETSGLAVLILCAAAVVVTSVVGDLTESMFKRHAEIKDSGTIFPGHGGVLDRLDSLLAAAPIFVLSIWWVLQ